MHLAFMLLHAPVHLIIDHQLYLALDVLVQFLKNKFCSTLKSFSDFEIDSIIDSLEAVLDLELPTRLLEERVVQAQNNGVVNRLCRHS